MTNSLPTVAFIIISVCRLLCNASIYKERLQKCSAEEKYAFQRYLSRPVRPQFASASGTTEARTVLQCWRSEDMV